MRDQFERELAKKRVWGMEGGGGVVVNVALCGMLGI